MKTFSLVLVIALVLVFTVGSVAEVSAYTRTEEDREFMAWVFVMIENISFSNEKLMDAMDNYDADGVVFWYGMMYNLSNNTLAEIDDFDVSPKMKPIKKELKSHFQDMKKVTYYGEKAFKTNNPDDMDIAVSYMDSAREHAENAIDMINKLTEEEKTPGFGVILAISSLLAVAYLVRRRR